MGVGIVDRGRAGPDHNRIDANVTPTFAIFVTPIGTVSFDAAANRVFVRILDESGMTRESTSVAVRTQ